MNKYSACIVAGGDGSRLGNVDKGFLKHEGKLFIERILAELTPFSHIMISTNDEERYKRFHLPLLADVHRSIGPIEGINQALQNMRGDWVFIISVDHPLFCKEISLYLEEFLCSDYDAVLPKDHLGNSYPLCAYYHKRCGTAFSRSISAGERKIRRVLQTLRVKEVDLSRAVFYSPKMMVNINTREDQKKLPLVVAVSGSQNSGKTTLICRLIAELKNRGQSAAVVKHTRHSYPFDEKGKDTFLYRQAGACAAAVFSPESFMINQDNPAPDFFKMFERYDVLLLEGFKDSPYQKIEIAGSEENKSPLNYVIAQVGGENPVLPVFAADQIQEITDFLLSRKWEKETI